MITINKKAIVSCVLLVIVWAGLIFIMSNMDTNKSNTKSKEVISRFIEKSIETANNLNITNKQPSENNMRKTIEELNVPLRKLAHATEYLILTVLLIIIFFKMGISRRKVFLFALLICFIYACTDEYHQSFVSGRTGQFADIIIDTAGGVVGCLVVMVRKLFVEVKNRRIRYKLLIFR